MPALFELKFCGTRAIVAMVFFYPFRLSFNAKQQIFQRSFVSLLNHGMIKSRQLFTSPFSKNGSFIKRGVLLWI
jgi:hypothetical protein